MQITLDIDFDEYYSDDSMNGFVDVVLDKAASQILGTFSRGSERNWNELMDAKMKQLRQDIVDECVKVFTDEYVEQIKEEVSTRIVEELEKKYNNSKSYRELKKELDLVSDTEINKGLKPYITAMVKNEVRKIIKI